MTNDIIVRAFALDDIEINGSGDGRTVTAYAAVFDIDTEVQDGHGHYIERNAAGAYAKSIAERGTRFGVFYNHGMTLHGTPSDAGSVPIGTALKVEPDRRGLLTVVRYNKTPLGETVLEAIKDGSLTSYSHTSRVIKSTPEGRIPRVRPGTPLPVVVRTELALKEFGPTPLPYYETAEIMAVRAALGTPLGAAEARHSRSGAGTGEPQTHSARNRILIRTRIAELGEF